jgi:hypothetical protein
VVNRDAFEIASMDDHRPAFEDWKDATVEERLRALEQLREIHLGARATERLQRLLVVVERAPR